MCSCIYSYGRHPYTGRSVVVESGDTRNIGQTEPRAAIFSALDTVRFSA